MIKQIQRFATLITFAVINSTNCMVKTFQAIGLGVVIRDTETQVYDFKAMPPTLFEESEEDSEEEEEIVDGTCIVIALKPDGKTKYGWQCTHFQKYDSVLDFETDWETLTDEATNQFFVLYDTGSLVDLANVRINDLAEFLDVI